MPAQKHIIQKQVLHVRMDDPVDSFEFRSKLGQVYHQNLLPKLETLFDEIGVHKNIRVDKLEINLGELDKKNWEEELASAAIVQVREQLEQATSYLVTKGNGNKDELIPSKTYTLDDWLFYYLEEGRLPWFVPNDLDIDAAIVSEWKTGIAKRIYDFIQTANVHQLTRLIYLLGSEKLDDVIVSCADKKVLDVWRFMKVHKPQFMVHMQSKRVPSFCEAKYVYLPLLQSAQDEATITSYFLYLVKCFAKDLSGSEELIAESLLQSVQVPVNEIAKLRDLLTEKGGKPETKTELQKRRDDKDETVVSYIDNAGLVLLYPFFTPFFTALGMLDGKNFINEIQRQRGAMLLQFLITGSTTMYEHQLLLNKILCGIGDEQSLPVSLEITNEEKEECEQLLFTLIEQWTMNGTKVNTTIDGLRSSFLSRPGKLDSKDNDWKLVVEQRPYDMVLNALPWTIGVIKTPWMKGMLWVEWC